MWKKREMECVNCGREYYHWHESCSRCSRSNVIKAKKQLKEKEQQKSDLLVQGTFLGMDEYAKNTGLINKINKVNIEVIDRVIRQKLRQVEHKAILGGYTDLYFILREIDEVVDLEKVQQKLLKAGYQIEIVYPKPFVELNLPTYKATIHHDIKLKIWKSVFEV